MAAGPKARSSTSRRRSEGRRLPASPSPPRSRGPRASSGSGTSGRAVGADIRAGDPGGDAPGVRGGRRWTLRALAGAVERTPYNLRKCPAYRRKRTPTDRTRSGRVAIGATPPWAISAPTPSSTSPAAAPPPTRSRRTRSRIILGGDSPLPESGRIHPHRCSPIRTTGAKTINRPREWDKSGPAVRPTPSPSDEARAASRHRTRKEVPGPPSPWYAS